MCGISCLLSLASPHCELDLTAYEHLKRRGPDSIQYLTVMDNYRCLFSAHVLHMRGPLTPQPLQDDDGNVLVWNGEIFGGLPVKPAENDTVVLSRRLSSCTLPSMILYVLSSMRGPWAFMYYQAADDYLWFGRDFFGRRSLLWRFDAGVFSLTSVAARNDELDWQEVPTAGVYGIDLKAATEAGAVTFEVFPWLQYGDDLSSFSIETIMSSVPSGCTAVLHESSLRLISPLHPLNNDIPILLNKAEMNPNSQPCVTDLEQLLAGVKQSKKVKRLIEVLSEAVRRRVQSLPVHDSPDNDQARVAILFSGGIDSMVLAALADRHIPAHQPIDLLNVAFKLQEPKKQKDSAKNLKKAKNKPTDPQADEACSQSFRPFDVPDRITGRAGIGELRDVNPERRWNFVEINVTQEELQKMRQERICHLVHPLHTVLDDSIGCAMWFAARGAGLIMDDDGGNHRPFTSSAKVRCRHLCLVFGAKRYKPMSHLTACILEPMWIFFVQILK